MTRIPCERRWSITIGILVLCCILGVATGCVSKSCSRHPEYYDDPKYIDAREYVLAYFRLVAIPEMESSLDRTVRTLGRMFGDVAVHREEVGPGEWRDAQEAIARAPMATGVSKSMLMQGVWGTGNYRASMTAVGCSLPTLKKVLTEADGIEYWQSPDASGSQADVVGVIVNRAALGAKAPSEVLGSEIQISVLVATQDLPVMRSAVVRIDGVFDAGLHIPGVWVYVPLEELCAITGRDPEECTELWVWLDAGRSDLSSDRAVVTEVVAKQLGERGVPEAALRIESARQRYSTLLEGHVRSLMEAKKAVEILSGSP